ncbi:hypothetical protein C7B69_23900 [filamentous cyanobacterium Phorm 46]|nr:hypothetical protein C7B69_23900 [filamentous cyanobacterium Phorm 46]PSB50463.1 hypothetical protein C7B67_14350 [filamentous cyanobacterium Phorm 6]
MIPMQTGRTEVLTTSLTQVRSEDFSPQKFDTSPGALSTPATSSQTTTVAPQTDIPLEKDAVRPNLRWEIKKLCDRTTINGQPVISSISQYSSFYSK